MTVSLFLSRHSSQWGQLRDDLLALIDANSISHDADKLPLAVSAEGRSTLNQGFTDRIAGFASCRRLLHNLMPLDADIQPSEATFETPPDGTDDDASPFPSMPAPVKPK